MAYPYGPQGAPAVGTGAPGLPSRSSARGEVLFTIPGVYLWTVPDGVFSVCALTVGGGGGPLYGLANLEVSTGAGAATAYINNYPVTPGQQIPVQVGDAGLSSNSTATAGGASIFADTSTCAVNGGSAGASGVTAAGGTVIAGTGWPGGNGARLVGGSSATYASGGTAGGYSGPGANGVATTTSAAGNPGTGGSAASGAVATTGANGSGGLGCFGESASGAASGQGGSGGQSGRAAINVSIPGQAGLFGTGGSATTNAGFSNGQPGTSGFVRILWGADRFFPSNDVGPS